VRGGRAGPSDGYGDGRTRRSRQAPLHDQRERRLGPHSRQRRYAGPRSPDSRNAIRAFLDATRCECVRLFDINLRPPYVDREIIEDSLRRAGSLKLSDDELPVLADLLSLPGDESDFLDEIVSGFDLNMVILTKGSKGSRLRTPSADCSRAGIATTIADTVGAGDSFNAAVVMGLLAGLSIEQINDGANRLASFVCANKGATPRPHLGLVDKVLAR